MKKIIITTIIFFAIGVYVGRAFTKKEPVNVASVQDAIIKVEKPKAWNRVKLDAWARSVYAQL